MKKLVLAAALVFGGFTAFAGTPVISNDVNKVIYLGDFVEIDASDLPAAVTDALKADYPEATLSKAYVNEDKTKYKLEVTMGEETATLYANENGEWIKE
ncbi:hypothetical protein [Robertkochia solimangrovi]|uniref:hypothetical protein n=1 Tax=Robertkochia solimangrovi TaxID=2213046 RepID=UPI00117E702C|nr:hypothetical protein [Robertkochia solimangrovi]TRZ46401.1 hypothetical protein DMZ48_03885 [Robertkochia solimangrovi]